MGKYSKFDAKRDVIVTDVTGVVANGRAVIDAIFDELIALAKSRPKKPWVVSCWKDVRFEDPALASYYGERTAGLLQHVAGVVRYAANDPITRALVRSQTLKHRTEGTRSNIYETFEEALAAVREAEKKAST